MAALAYPDGQPRFPVGTPVRYHDCIHPAPVNCVETLDGPLQEETFEVGDAGTYIGESNSGPVSWPVVAVRIGERDLLAVCAPYMLSEITPAAIS